jgi:aryl-alcohol dehydrogenase-like predicted oxidoreductase
MERRRLGRTGLEVSALGFGASEIGYQGVAAPTVAELLHAALDAGLNLVDTAACYANSEELIGAAIGGRRREYYLMTKCGHPAGLPMSEWTPELIPASIARSLRRLRTDYLDVVQFHSCDARTMRNEDLLAALVRAREAGHTRFIGYSGDGGDALHAVASGIFDTLQISVNLADQQAIDRVLPQALERDMGIIAKRPLANAAWTLSRWRIGAYERPYLTRLRKLKYEFLRHAPQDAFAAALRFTLSVPGVHTAIVGTTKPGRWQQNAALLAAGPLSAAEFTSIRQRWAAVAAPNWTGQR